MSENRRRRPQQPVQPVAAPRKKKKKNSKVKSYLAILAMMVLVATVSIGGTLAWLVDDTDEITNTFTTAGIDISLTETLQSDGETLADNEEWTAQLIPGVTYSKNPIVTVESETDVPVYLFVKVNPSTSKTYLDYKFAWEYVSTGEGDEKASLYSGWTQLTDADLAANEEVWYRPVEADDADQSWHLIVDDQVKIKEDLLKADTNDSTLSMPADSFTIGFKAYSIQQAQFNTPLAAWNEVSDVE